MRRSSGALGSLVLSACLLTTGGPGTAPAVATTASTTSASCGTELLVSNDHTFACSWSDDFTQSSLDTAKWTPFDTSANGYTTASRECYRPDTRNVEVRNGTLRLTVRREVFPITCTTPSGSFKTRYTAGGVMTWSKFTQTYGRFDFRAAFPAASAGLQSALWLYPQELTYGRWPASGEIDAAEYYGTYPDRAIPALHYTTSLLGSQLSGLGCYRSDPQQFHTYTVEWTPGMLRFLQDGAECWRHSPQADGLTSPAPFDQPFFLLLNQALGAGANLVTSSTRLPATMSVDYVRVWSLAS
ncbi:beta-glucanase [Nocardioides phosphati]|uniref:Beta-glucanase n=1 Tax=Nocardioides phosphati TaxID=1867775 RepID=A0ABQ2NEV5_9ACTN|nr:glycoside hydrolase family 16 protein [Nocardioides phosphati]GGO93627.1 beta-glucanase [Nocardioides phosphati]